MLFTFIWTFQLSHGFICVSSGYFPSSAVSTAVFHVEEGGEGGCRVCLSMVCSELAVVTWAEGGASRGGGRRGGRVVALSVAGFFRIGWCDVSGMGGGRRGFWWKQERKVESRFYLSFVKGTTGPRGWSVGV